MRICELQCLPNDRAVALAERDHSIALAPGLVDQHVLIGQRMAGIAVLELRGVKLVIQVMRPFHLAGFFIERMDFAGAAGRNQAIPHYFRHGIRPRPHRLGIRIRKRIVVFVFPNCLAGSRIERGNHVVRIAAIGSVEHATLLGHRGIAIAQRPDPDLLRTFRWPGIRQPRRVDNEIAILAAPDQPILAHRSRLYRGSAPLHQGALVNCLPRQRPNRQGHNYRFRCVPHVSIGRNGRHFVPGSRLFLSGLNPELFYKE